MNPDAQASCAPQDLSPSRREAKHLHLKQVFTAFKKQRHKTNKQINHRPIKSAQERLFPLAGGYLISTRWILLMSRVASSVRGGDVPFLTVSSYEVWSQEAHMAEWSEHAEH